MRNVSETIQSKTMTFNLRKSFFGRGFRFTNETLLLERYFVYELFLPWEGFFSEASDVAQVRIRKRGKTYSYIFEAGKVDGKRKVVEKGGFPTKTAAYKAGVEAYNDFIHGNIGITSEAVTLKDFMTAWLTNVVALNVKPTSIQTYQSHFKNHIIPHLGDKKVQDLTPAMLDEWLRKLLQGGLAQKTLSVIHALVHNALNYAVYPAQLISSNPAVYVKVPKNAPRNVISGQ